jgi:hypothetical protein
MNEMSWNRHGCGSQLSPHGKPAARIIHMQYSSGLRVPRPGSTVLGPSKFVSVFVHVMSLNIAMIPSRSRALCVTHTLERMLSIKAVSMLPPGALLEMNLVWPMPMMASCFCKIKPSPIDTSDLC